MDGKKVTVPEEIVQDPYALLLYEKALQAGKEKDKSIRVNIVGNFRQGKTTLMRRLLGQEIRDITSTNGIVVEHYRCEKTKDGKLRYTKADDIDNSEYVKRLVSVAVSEETESKEQQTLSVAKPNASQGQKPKVREDSPTSHNEVRDTQENVSETKSVSSTENEKNNDISNKVPVLSPEGKEAFVKALRTNQSFSEPERQTVFNIWDFGGQYIFYATDTIFHSRRAIYLLVFDLTLDLNQCITDEQFPVETDARNMKYFIQFWMSSIHSFVGSADGSVPKVILVGTHKDKLKGKRYEREKYIQSYFEGIRNMFDGTNMSYHIHFNDFAVDNTVANDPSLNSLRETIIRIGDEQSETFAIPLKWIQLEKSLLERKHFKLISLKFVLAIDSENEFPLNDIEQVKLFLRYHHAKGTFVYFDEAPISEYVVLDPQYLIDAFKCIITSERFCTNDPDIRPFWNMLLTEGRLEKHLIDRQWGKPEDKWLNITLYQKQQYLMKTHNGQQGLGGL
ncbi:probable serine/threonine-protein kinase pats1 [Mercenaria mercenaria]|uniref:probable serine/threonine-protein kinase pats1 n=1 Tax=Mercenaria mercenaria TaxID=6596 RepID=UPI00234F2C55|nr:probable serine/threonine-protein kinase pats1 [Mercenaria mercenaria]